MCIPVATREDHVGNACMRNKISKFENTLQEGLLKWIGRAQCAPSKAPMRMSSVIEMTRVRR